jgi:hypothetical protein
MGEALELDGTALLGAMARYLAPVTGSQAIGRHFPRIIELICGSEFDHGNLFL